MRFCMASRYGASDISGQSPKKRSVIGAARARVIAAAENRLTSQR